MRKVCSAIEGVHVPTEFGLGFMPGTLFCGYGMVRKIFRELLNNQFFGAFIRLRNEVHFPFVSNLRRPCGFLS